MGHVWRWEDNLVEVVCPSTFASVPGINLGASGLRVGAFAHWAISSETESHTETPDRLKLNKNLPTLASGEGM